MVQVGPVPQIFSRACGFSMETSIGTTRSLTTGLLVSVGFHVAVAGALVRYGDLLGSFQNTNIVSEVAVTLTIPDVADQPKDELREKQLHLGIEKSSVVTETWLGFSDPNEHSGPLASVEQAAMSLRAAGQAGADQPEIASSDTSVATQAQPEAIADLAAQPIPDSTSNSITKKISASILEPSSLPSTELTTRAEPQVQERAKAEDDARAKLMPDQLPNQRATPELPQALPDERSAPTESLIIEANLRPQTKSKTVDLETPRSAEAVKVEPAKTEAPPEKPVISTSPEVPILELLDPQPSPAVPEASPAVAPTPLFPPLAPPANPKPPSPPSVDTEKRLAKPQRVSGDRPGVMSDRESVAAAMKEAINVRPGRPAAAEGLEIKTTNPRWSVTTQLTASPRNPVVWIAFGRNGKVIDADFLNGEKTGSGSVDEPLLHAIFTWRAKGVALDELPEADPKAAVRVVLRITLRGS